MKTKIVTKTLAENDTKAKQNRRAKDHEKLNRLMKKQKIKELPKIKSSTKKKFKKIIEKFQQSVTNGQGHKYGDRAFIGVGILKKPKDHLVKGINEMTIFIAEVDDKTQECMTADINLMPTEAEDLMDAIKHTLKEYKKLKK